MTLPIPSVFHVKRSQRFSKLAPYGKDVLLWGCGVGDILDVLLAKTEQCSALGARSVASSASSQKSEILNLFFARDSFGF